MSGKGKGPSESERNRDDDDEEDVGAPGDSSSDSDSVPPKLGEAATSAMKRNLANDRCKKIRELRDQVETAFGLLTPLERQLHITQQTVLDIGMLGGGNVRELSVGPKGDVEELLDRINMLSPLLHGW